MKSRYQVIPRTLIFVFCRDRVLLIHGAETKENFPGLYNGLGGHVEHGETIREGAARELFEESGIEGIPLELCGISVDATRAEAGVEVHIFRGEVMSEPALRASSEGTLEWVRREDVATLRAVPDLVPFLERIWDWKRGTPIFYALADWSANPEIRLRFDEN